MKAAGIWEEMRYFASNHGSHLTAGWNHLWGFKVLTPASPAARI